MRKHTTHEIWYTFSDICGKGKYENTDNTKSREREKTTES